MTPQVPGPTIGVFDSGFGGLTVLRALLPLIPNAHYIYFGDTARLPYGSKSQATVARYAIEAARFLHARGAEHLVIACNTATALGLPEITAAVPIPVHGVIQPGALAARAATTLNPEPSALNPVLVLATAATVASHAYRDACAALSLNAVEKACPLLVPLVEEGWTDHPVTREVLRIYLREALAECSPAAVVLGCTHYPLIAGVIRQTLAELGHTIPVVDSAEATAHSVAHALTSQQLTAHTAAHALTTPGPEAHTAAHAPTTAEFFATDSIEKFQRLGSHFLGQHLPTVHLLDLGG